MVSYEDIKEIRNHPDQYLIDVRNKDELEKTGAIPGSMNIPMCDLEAALNMSANDFKMEYNRTKPSEDTPLIFTCLSGGRAQRATDLAISLGFKYSTCYKGSWTEWAQKEGL